MRILYLTEERISFLDAMVRGGAIHVERVVNGLRDRGHDIFLLDWNPAAEKPFQRSISPRTRFVDGPLRTAMRAISVGSAENVDVVVSKTRKTYLPGLVAASRIGVPHVVHVGSSLDQPTGSIVNQLDVFSFITRLRAPHDAYFVVCEHVGSQLRTWGVNDSRIFSVGNAVDTDRFHPDRISVSLDEQFYHQIQSLDSPFMLGYVGGLQSFKGLDDLAAAVDSVDGECHVLVAGDGPEQERLERVFGASATFLGSVPYEQMPALYHEMDAFVLPSRTEGLPRVVLEAQATGIPVVATAVGGIPEVVEDGKTGLLFEPSNPAALQAAIQRLVDDESLRDQLAVTGRTAVERNYSWSDLFNRYETSLERVISSP